MVQVLDRAVEPLPVDGLEDQGIAYRIGPFMHAPSLQDQHVVLSVATKWNKANK
jgi:hypothetical protein